MSRQMSDTVLKEDIAASPVVSVMLEGFDELTEVDLNRDQYRLLRHTEGKYFAPAIDCGFREMFQYVARYLIHPDDRERYSRENDPDALLARLESDEGNGEFRSRFRYRLLNGSWRWVEQAAFGGASYAMPQGTYYAFLRDVEDEVHHSQRVEEPTNVAEYNALTGLRYEEPFFRQARHFIREHSEGWCMVALDLEHFKLFNEWYGRDQGDLVLATVGAKLAELEQNMGGLACYLGQDDFALLIPFDMACIEALYEEIHELIRRHGTSVGFLPAIGVSLVGSAGEISIYDVYDHAALAARCAKDDYHDRIRLFEMTMILQTDRDYHILSDFQKALRDHELFIQLQPQCRIKNGKVVGAESLVRWKKTTGEMVSPGLFVPVLEKYGFVTDLDQYVWEEVCAWQKRWIDSGHTPLPISVNVSQIDIYTIDVPDFFEKLIEKYQLPVEVIKIEITESAYVDNELVAATVTRLREKGFLVLMDDFGSGYSSLNMLRNLNVDIIKLDARFLRMSRDDRKGIQIMESIVNMAKTMGVPIIVEGVETKEESDFLKGLGCRYVQGYFFYRPMPLEEFEALISDPKHTDTRGFRFKAREQFHVREFLDQNLFSDTVLNEILGPVGFYVWKGDDVDIVRHNDQLDREIRVAGIEGRLESIQNFLVPEDKPEFYRILEEAMQVSGSGAEGVVRFVQPGNVIEPFRVRFFFLNEDEEGRHFYGSAHNLTEFTTLNDHMRLLSQVSTDSVVFARKVGSRWSFRVVIHGLREALGLSYRKMQNELDDQSFYERIEKSTRERLIRFARGETDDGEAGFSFPFPIRTESGQPLLLRVKFDYVHDKASGVEYVLTLRAETSVKN